MRNLNLFAGKNNSQRGNSPVHLPLIHKGTKLLVMTILCFSFLCFMPIHQQKNTTQSAKLVLDPEDMVENGIYFFADHGNGMSVAQFDRMQGNDIYTKGSIKPLLLSFSGPGLWGTITEAGNIRLATLTETIQLLLSIIAGEYIPYP